MQLARLYFGRQSKAMAGKPKSAETPAERIVATIGGNRLETLQSGEERLKVLLELIAGARESLRVIFYIFASDEAGEQVRDALVAAARRGVQVRLLVDGFGSSGTSPDFFQPIADEGGDYCTFEPSYGRRYLIRNHQKLVVADEKIAVIGGANVENTYLTDTGERHWRDLWLIIEGPEAKPASRYFDSLFLWTTTKGAKLRTLRRIVVHHSQSEGVLQWKFSGPLSRKNRLPAALAREMATANRFDLIAAYFSPPWSFLRRLGRIARRGKARVITAALSDNNATIAAARHTYSRLLRRKVGMYEYRAAKLHTKLAILDDVTFVGSANLDFRSLFINMEIVLRIDDAGFAEAMRGYFEHELRRCEHITPALHRKRATLWRRIKWTVSYWLVTSLDYTVARRLNFIER